MGSAANRRWRMRPVSGLPLCPFLMYAPPLRPPPDEGFLVQRFRQMELKPAAEALGLMLL